MSESVQCTIDESVQSEEDAIQPIGQKMADSAISLARTVLDLREVSASLYAVMMRQEMANRLSLLAYACEVPSRRKRTQMNVPQMVSDWLPLVKKLACAHDIDEKDAASAELDELLAPILAAPITQVREFYRELVRQMKADKDIPWAIWRLFEFWGENILDKINKEEVIGLKKQLAEKIAESSMGQIPREDWINAMVGALQWRTPEKLQKIEKGLSAGRRPRVKGRESCLFLEVGEAEVML